MGDFTVTLLGTGTPLPIPDRYGMSTLIRAGNSTLLFDCGRGAAVRLYQSEQTFSNTTDLFLTHLHSDHVSGIPDLWLTGLLAAYGPRKRPLHIYGPNGTANMASHLEMAYSADVEARSNQRVLGGTTGEAAELRAQEFDAGLVYDQGGVKVSAFLVEHNVIEPAFGFRVEYRGRTIVLSGDTAYCENLIQNSRDVDLLVHEVMAVPNGPDIESPNTARMMYAHTSPEQVGEISSQINPKLLVYSHIICRPGATEEDIASRTRKTYDGEFHVGRDLDRFDVGETVTKIS